MDIASLIIWFIIVVCISGLLFAFYHYKDVAEIKVTKSLPQSYEKETISDIRSLGDQEYEKLLRAGDHIHSSAMTYLLEEYSILGGYVLGFGFLVYVISFISLAFR